MLFSMASICLWKLGTSTCSRVSILSSASANSWKHFSTRMPSCKVQHDIDLEFCTAKPGRAGYMGAALARYCCKTCRSKDWAPQERKYCQVGQSNAVEMAMMTQSDLLLQILQTAVHMLVVATAQGRMRIWNIATCQ